MHEARRRNTRRNPRHPAYCETGRPYLRRTCGLGYFVFGLDSILAFWLVYILTRPLGASFGDLLSQPTQYGGVGLGTVITSAIFLVTIVAVVIYMSVRHQGEELVGAPD